jgi:hypothetical protein
MVRQEANMMWRFRQPQRRGVAMLLVLISLMVATVLTTAYLSSRDNSALIGENVAQAAAARWGAASALTLGMTVMETEADWRDGHANGIIMQNFPLAQANLAVSLRDIETNGLPNASTTYVELTASATAGDIEHDATATLLVPVPHLASVDLAEFAAFGSDGITLRSASTIERWASAPLSELNRPLAMGTQSSGFGTVSISRTSLATDAVAWLPPGASGSSVSNSSDLDVNAVVMQDTINFPQPPSPPVTSDGSPTHAAPVLSGDVTLNGGVRRHSHILQNSTASLYFSNGGILVSNGSFTIQNGYTLNIHGNATIVVFGDVDIHRNARIVLHPGARLRLFVAGDIDGQRVYIGELGGDTSGPNSDGLGYTNVHRVQLYSIADEDGDDDPAWTFTDQSLIKATIYAPHAEFELNNSRMCGRVAARTITLRSGSRLYYDHALDRRAGYTNEHSPLYNDAGRVKPAVLALASLNNADLEALAEAENIQVTSDTRTYKSSSLVTGVVESADATLRKITIVLGRSVYDTDIQHLEP